MRRPSRSPISLKISARHAFLSSRPLLLHLPCVLQCLRRRPCSLQPPCDTDLRGTDVERRLGWPPQQTRVAYAPELLLSSAGSGNGSHGLLLLRLEQRGRLLSQRGVLVHEHLLPRQEFSFVVKCLSWTLWRQPGWTHHRVHEETEIQQVGRGLSLASR
jgi:hypothetical protein